MTERSHICNFWDGPLHALLTPQLLHLNIRSSKPQLKHQWYVGFLKLCNGENIMYHRGELNAVSRDWTNPSRAYCREIFDPLCKHGAIKPHVSDSHSPWHLTHTHMHTYTFACASLYMSPHTRTYKHTRRRTHTLFDKRRNVLSKRLWKYI